MLLADAHESNPFYSEALRSLGEEAPECIDRIILDIVERELRLIRPENKVYGETVLLSLFGEEYEHRDEERLFDLEKWKKNARGVKNILMGTRSSFGREATPFLKERYDFIKTLWVERGSELSNSLLERAESCNRKISLTSFFPYFDRDSIYSLLGRVRHNGRDIEEIKTEVKQAAESSVGFIAEKEKEFGEISGTSLALRPILGLLLKDINISQTFVRAILELIVDLAYEDHGLRGKFLTGESCRAISPIAKWANIIGFNIPLLNKEAFGVTKKLYVEHSKIITAIAGMKDSTNRDARSDCLNAFGDLSKLWNHTWNHDPGEVTIYDKRMSPWTRASQDFEVFKQLDFERGFGADLTYLIFLDIDTGWHFKAGIYKINSEKGVKEAVVSDVSKRDLELLPSMVDAVYIHSRAMAHTYLTRIREEDPFMEELRELHNGMSRD
jgi:hypothetical protein